MGETPTPLKIQPQSISAQSERALSVRTFESRHVAAARELRDRWLEQVNSGQFVLSSGKYDVSRQLESVRVKDIRLLAA